MMPHMRGEMCTRCVLTTDVPRVNLDPDGVCTVCRDYEAHGVNYRNYFKTEKDLTDLFSKVRNAGSPYDVLLMYSGGKDSTYVLYRLIDMGCRILALTFDNGYIPQGCFDNIKGVCENANVDSVIVSVPKANMDETFAESLRRKGMVCYGCFRGLTARGTEVAIEKGIPIIMTGLSRGQIFDTKVYKIVANCVVDPDQIDDYLLQFREVYHGVDDKIAMLIDDKALQDEEAFRRTHFIDFFRYCAATKKEIKDLIEQRAPYWRKPANVGGCSSNCLINDVGIHVHLQARGFHNYAIATAWEVRFGHIARAAAIEELTFDIDIKKVNSILKVIGYRVAK